MWNRCVVVMVMLDNITHRTCCMKGLLKGLEDLYQEKKTYLVELMESCDTDLSQLSALLISSMKALSGEALSGEERDDIMKQVVSYTDGHGGKWAGFATPWRCKIG